MNGTHRLSWDEYGLHIATVAAMRSEDPWLKVGSCVLRADNTVAATGYNGAPAGQDIDWADRGKRRALVIHAEANALRYCTPADIRGGRVYVTHHPCGECVKLIAAYGISAVVYAHDLDPAVYDQDDIAAHAAALGVCIIHLSTAKENE